MSAEPGKPQGLTNSTNSSDAGDQEPASGNADNSGSIDDGDHLTNSDNSGNADRIDNGSDNSGNADRIDNGSDNSGNAMSPNVTELCEEGNQLHRNPTEYYPEEAIGGRGHPEGAIGGQGHPEGSIGGQDHPAGAIGGQDHPEGAIEGQGRPEGATVDHPKEANAWKPECDAVLVFAEKDSELADEMKRDMNELVLSNGRKARVRLYTEEIFGGSKVKRAEIMLNTCNFILVILTENTRKDDYALFLKEETVASTRFGEELNDQRKYCVLPIHTQPEKQRSYQLPAGLAAVVSIDWYKSPEHRQKYLKQLFENTLVLTKDLHEMSPELQRIKNDSKGLLGTWQKEEIFYESRASRHAMDVLQRKGSVFIVGRSGDGKTSLAYHILTKIKENERSFKPYIITKPEDIDHIPVQNSVVFVDNIFGKSHFNPPQFEKWKLCFQRIAGYVEVGDMYFISALPCHVKDECSHQISGITLLSNAVDTVNEHRLRRYEKKEMLIQYKSKHELELSEEDINHAIDTSLSLGFPRCCKQYATNKEARNYGIKFFKMPYDFLSKQIEGFKTNEKLAFMVLVMCLLRNENLSVKLFDPFREANPPSETNAFLESIMEACGVSNTSPKGDIKAAAQMLCKMGYLTYNGVDGYYSFAHQSIYKAVGVAFGKKYINQIFECCHLDFLVDHTVLSVKDITAKENVILVSEVDYKHLIGRIVKEVKDGQCKVFEHNGFADDLFVKQCFSDELFTSALCDASFIEQLNSSGILYFLTSSMSCRTFLSNVIDLLKPMKGHMIQNLLHQILEGACIAGDLRIFSKVLAVEGVNICEECFLKAAAFPGDNSEMMARLPWSDSVEYDTSARVVAILVEKGKIEVLRKLSEHIDWDLFKNPLRQKVLIIACELGHFEIFKWLRTKIEKIIIKDRLLFALVCGGNMQILKSLVTKKNINWTYKNGRTLLHHACLNIPKLCTFLIQKGIDQTIVDNFGYSAFDLACRKQNKKTLESLIDIGLNCTESNALHMAAQNVNGAKLVELILQKSSATDDLLNCQDKKGRTALHIASARQSGDKMIDELRARRVNACLKDKKGRTALHLAAELHFPSNILSLLHHESDVNAVDHEGKSPLHYVLGRKPTEDGKEAFKDSIDHMLESEADVFLQDNDGNTPIHVAMLNEVPADILETIIRKGNTQMTLNKKGFTPLHILLKNRPTKEHLDLFKKYSPELFRTETAVGKKLLDIALQSKCAFNIVQDILDIVPNDIQAIDWEKIDIKSITKYSSEDIVSFCQQCERYFSSSFRCELIHLLCERNMSDELWKDGMNSLIDKESETSTENCVPLLLKPKVLRSCVKINYLISLGAAVNAKGNVTGSTPMHLTSFVGNVEGIKILLEHGGDVNIRNANNQTALAIMLKMSFNLRLLMVSPEMFPSLDRSDFEDSYPMKNVLLMTNLLMHAASMNSLDDSGYAAIHYCLYSKDLLKKLVSGGANLKLKTKDGMSCLHLACRNENNTEVINYLLDKGLSPNDEDSEGNTPLYYSLQHSRNNFQVISILISCTSQLNLKKNPIYTHGCQYK